VTFLFFLKPQPIQDDDSLFDIPDAKKPKNAFSMVSTAKHDRRDQTADELS
jgi:hypothetical protein